MAGKKVGRPRGNPKWVADWQMQFCLRIESGRSARSICGDEDMPDWSTVKARLDFDAEFSAQYARACEWRADAIFEEMFEIADDGRNDWIESKDPENPGWVVNSENVQRSRLRIDARKWLLARMAPKKYGERLAVDTTVSVADQTEEQKLDRFIAQIPVLNEILAGRGFKVVAI